MTSTERLYTMVWLGVAPEHEGDDDAVVETIKQTTENFMDMVMQLWESVATRSTKAR